MLLISTFYVTIFKIFVIFNGINSLNEYLSYESLIAKVPGLLQIVIRVYLKTCCYVEKTIIKSLL